MRVGRYERIKERQNEGPELLLRPGPLFTPATRLELLASLPACMWLAAALRSCRIVYLASPLSRFGLLAR
jgi:hypothetical protein